MSHQTLEIVIQQDKSLLINFPELGGSQNLLVISPWEKGVSWCLYVENDDPEYMSYLSEPPISLEFFIKRTECMDWYHELPEELRDKLSIYPDLGFTLLYHISRYQTAYDLFITNPTVLCFLLLEAKSKAWTEQTVLGLLKNKCKCILGVCGFPSTKSAVRLVKRIKYKKLDSLAFSRISKLLKLSNYYLLNHYPVLSGKLIDLLSRFPWVIGSALTRHELKCYDKVVLQLAEIEGYDKYLNEVKIGKKRVYNCKNEVQLTRLHAKLHKRCGHKNYINNLPDNNYPPIPIPLPEGNWLLPLQGTKSLAIEADMMGGNCALSYDDAIKKGTYYIFKTLNPVAMIGLELHKNTPPSIDQIELYSNKRADVLEDIHNRMHRWLYDRHKTPYFRSQLNRVRYIRQSSKPFFRKLFDCSQLTLDFCTKENVKKTFISTLGENIEWALRGNPDEDDKGIFLHKEDILKGVLFLNIFNFSTPEEPEVDMKIVKDNFNATDIKALDNVVNKSLQTVEQSFKDYDEIYLKTFIDSIWGACLHGLWLERILDNGGQIHSKCTTFRNDF